MKSYQVALMLLASFVTTLVLLLILIPPNSGRETATEAAVEIVKAQRSVYSQTGAYTRSELTLQEINPEVGQYLANSNLEYTTLEMVDKNRTLFQIRSESSNGRRAQPTIRVLMVGDQVVSVSCLEVGSACQQEPVLQTYQFSG